MIDLAGGTNALGDGLDIKARGGYVVGAGSVFNDRRYKIARALPVAPMPQRLLDRLKEATPKSAKNMAPAVPLDQPDAIARAIAYLRDDAPPAEQGKGGDLTAYKVFCRVKDMGVSQGFASDLAHEHYAEKCVPYDADWLEAKVASAYAYGRNRPGVQHPQASFGGVQMDAGQPNPGRFGSFGNFGTWDQPDLALLDGEDAPPVFPREVLGQWGPWCEQAAKAGNSPFDYSAGALLATTAALIGNTREVVLGHDWTQPSVLWITFVGPPSSGKSPAMDPFTRTLAEFERDRQKVFELAQRVHAGEVLRAKAARAEWESKFKPGEKNEGLDLPADAIVPPPPRAPRLMVADPTIEAMAEIMSGNPRGLFLVRDELSGWWRSMNRYAGEKGGEVQFWIEAYGARAWTVDRKTNPAPIRISRLAVSVMGGVQPDVLAKLLVREADGFAARFLWTYPANAKGFELPARPLDRELLRAAMRSLSSLEPDDPEANWRPVSCPVSAQGTERFVAWWSATRDKATASRGFYGEWLGKAGGLALRLALVLEHLWWAIEQVPAEIAKIAKIDVRFEFPPAEVSLRAIEAAIQLIDQWAAPMALRVGGITGASEAEQDAAALAKWLNQFRIRNFNARDVRRTRTLGGRLSTAGGITAACEILERAGIIRRDAPSGDRGRPPLNFEVNPALWSSEAAV